MSQEQPPIPSRRELRRARDARLEETGASPAGAAAGAPEDANHASGGASANRVRRVADAPLDAKPASERSSQARARDRAALRAIKELADKEQQLSRGGPPTRRQLRLQQLQEEVAPGTSAIPVVPAPGSGPRTSNVPAQSSGKPRPGADRPGVAPGGGVRVTAGPPPGGQEMTVEQALMARELLAAQANNQSNKLEHIAAMESAVQKVPAVEPAVSGTDAEPADPEALAEQIAQAEREAVLNKRAMAKQKLAEQNSRPSAPVRAEPSVASNLAMVTPLEFVKVPGLDRPVMKPPGTTFVPLVTSPAPKLKPGQSASGKSRGLRGRAGVLARAEAAAKAAGRRPASNSASDGEAFADAAEHPPVSASSAYGLEPLDAATAGLGRAQRTRLLVLGLIGIGTIALIAGIIMITSGLSR
ncbi:hypothetical protein [Arthrobacter bambusae]|uniref:hypothetical protein n=1 Tax=Arthrobacter bambusae TaxID=1338426 RepID=UPI002781508A|nr:hypothetical protein [Arthrobacter bambusae]MDQ0030491.1 hypothetical protein [Arthrobacter bambusae]MDQ0098408.1 hypothetical protein [Arthrobacter bambusae]